MGKNIVLCSDGTANRGGYTPDSNVYKMYKAVDIHNKDKQQITFYDNGVGTEDNKYVRGATGALGIGFKRNVCDLYAFLARNYEEGDDVYFFGFSRGAATVRACAGFIAACGLVDGRDMEEEALNKSVNEAVKAYSNRSRAKPCKGNGSHGVIPIKFIGVWDTVSSLGFPQKWDKASIGLFVLNAIFMGLDRVSDYVLPHRFYNYELTDNIEYACQALAVDDARSSFWPMVWKEKKHATHVEQVWFSGMHSNVGGGYERAGMANVALAWMMQRAINNGLVFKANAFDNAKADANPHGRIYDSRDGFSIYYRYHPREIEKECKKKLNDNRIKIHESVIERMKHKTANYAPGNIPMHFDVVGDAGTVKESTIYDTESEKTLVLSIKKKIRTWTRCRKWLYGMFLESTIAVAVFALYYKNVEPSWVKPIGCFCPKMLPEKENGWIGWILDKLDSVIPNILNGALEVAVIQHREYFIGTLSVFIGYWIIRSYCKRKSDDASEELREVILKAIKPKQ